MVQSVHSNDKIIGTISKALNGDFKVISLNALAHLLLVILVVGATSYINSHTEKALLPITNQVSDLQISVADLHNYDTLHTDSATQLVLIERVLEEIEEQVESLNERINLLTLQKGDR